LRAVAETGIDRIRFATSHPKDLSFDTIAAMADVPAVMPYLHLPIQSGSNRILAAMNRRYTRDDYLTLVAGARAAIPGLALSTDIIVGFPGETEDDFDDTLDVVREVGFDQAFTFIYSPREGTPAASLEHRVPREASQPRFDRLVEAVHSSAYANNQLLLGSIQTVLFEGVSKRDELTLAGRTPTNKVVHVPVPGGRVGAEFSGRLLDVEVTEAQTWFLGGRLLGTE
jgi:tRNA-2-methylthio-N6-dimethylallyladenosine synthase